MSGFGLIRQHRGRRRVRLHQEVALNLVSMMDVFTVLLFFLLVNSSAVFSQVRVLGMALPTATVDGAPPSTEEARLDLIVRTDALELEGNAWGANSKRRLINFGGHYDVNNLGKLLAQAKDLWPDKKDIAVLVESDVSYEDLVRVMDATRAVDTVRGRVELFPDITLGDAPKLGGVK